MIKYESVKKLLRFLRRNLAILIIMIVVLSINGCQAESVFPLQFLSEKPEEAAKKLVLTGRFNPETNIGIGNLQIKQVKYQKDKALVLLSVEAKGQKNLLYLIETRNYLIGWVPLGGSMSQKGLEKPITVEVELGKKPSGISYTAIFGLSQKDVSLIRVTFKNKKIREDKIKNHSYLIFEEGEQTPLFIQALNSKNKVIYGEKLDNL